MVNVPLKLRYFYHKKKDIRSHDEYLFRIEKSLYYVNIPKAYCTSLPCTEFAAEIFSEINKFSLDKLDVEEAANLSRNACVSPCSLVLALLYLERLKSVNPKYLTTVSPSELFLISLMVGSKFLQDDGEEDEVNNYEWAASAGVDVQDINKAEKEFLDAIKWKVFVSEKEFWDRFRILECSLGFRQGCKRGWFTYTELHLLLGLIDVASLIQTFCTVTTACLTSYAASMLTLLGSTLLVAQIPGLGLRPEGQKINDNQDWNNLTTYNFTTNFRMQPNIPHHLIISSELSLKNSLRTVENDLKTCENGYSFADIRNINCEKLGYLDLFLKVSSLDLNDESDSDIKDIAGRSSVKVFQSCGSFWCWKGIKNHLFMNLGSNNRLSIMDY